MENRDFSIRKKYCPAVKQNVVFKINTAEPQNEICMDSANCKNKNCEWKQRPVNTVSGGGFSTGGKN